MGVRGSWWSSWNLALGGFRNSGEGAGKRVPRNLASAGPQVVGKHRDDRCRPSPHSCGIIVRLAGLLTQHGLLRLQSRPASFERDCFMLFDSGRSDHHSIHVQGVHVSAVQRAAEPLSVRTAQDLGLVAMRGEGVWTLIPGWILWLMPPLAIPGCGWHAVCVRQGLIRCTPIWCI